MPRRLNRKGYGHSYTWGKEQRVVSDKYKSGYDNIDWGHDKTTEDNGWQDGKNAIFGNCKRKVFK